MPKPTLRFNIEWDAYEYEHKERSSDWFWATGIIAVAIAIISVIFGNIIFAILVLVGSFSLSLFVNREPEAIRCTIDDTGVTRGKVKYPYSTLSSFWIDTYHSHKKIILKSKKLLMPLIIVPMSDMVDADEVHEKLSEYLEEEFHSLPLVEKMLEYFGF